MSQKFLSTFIAVTLAACLGACHATTREDFEEESEEATAPLSIVGCTFKVDKPHKSTHVPGTVNVVAWLQCNRPVERIEMTLGLALDGVELRRSTFSNSGMTYRQGNVAAPCVSGTYNGAAVATVTFPPGAFPRTGNGTAGSGDVHITC